jgi:RNA polymerase sigma-70 factor, ECF subfamily
VVSTDALLVERIAAGDDDALAEAFDRYARPVLSAARRVLGDSSAAEDVAQEVFVALWARPGAYAAERAPLCAYLATLARRRAIDVVRSELRRAGREDRHHRLSPDQGAASVEQLTEQRVVAGVVRRAVLALPEEQRQVVELAYFRGLSYRDVATVVGIPEGTAKSRLRLALTKLESLLDHDLLMETT